MRVPLSHGVLVPWPEQGKNTMSCMTVQYMHIQYLSPWSLQKALLPGIHSLMKHCSEEDTAFIQSSLDQTGRTRFQSLLEDHHKLKKFL